MTDNLQDWRQAEKLPEAVNERRCSYALRATAHEPAARGKPSRQALGRGLGGLLLHRRLCVAGRQAHALREEPLPQGLPFWARGFYRKVCRLGRKV